MLSLDGRMEDARAVTAEHLELLEAVDARRSRWVTIERCAANWPGTTRSSCFFPHLISNEAPQCQFAVVQGC
ncbi:hypothetical protein H6G65_16870 [Microcystis elabens FACHB-917]|nr:hypothetical protein [Microcystis elabens FACHB-917]